MKLLYTTVLLIVFAPMLHSAPPDTRDKMQLAWYLWGQQIVNRHIGTDGKVRSSIHNDSEFVKWLGSAETSGILYLNTEPKPERGAILFKFTD